MSHKLLIVDDEAHILQVLSLKLRHCGYHITTAVDGEDALHQVKVEAPDLVITDVQMPFVNGLELAHALHNDKNTTHIPVVVLTARGHTLATSDTDIPNVKKVIGKPFSPRGIVELVEDLLKDTPIPTSNTSEAA